MPRKFDSTDPVDRIIYEEDQEIAEMLFILEGKVGIAINQYSQRIMKNFYKVGRIQQGMQLICDYYVIHKKRSNFIYLALEDIHSYGMDRKYLHNQILKQFPDAELHFKLSSLFFYNKLIGKPLNDFK